MGVLPIRGLLTIGFTMAVSLLVAVGTFEQGWLSGVSDALGRTGPLHFMVPPMSFAIVLGLSLDYDVFLLGRILEFRLAGYSDKRAIELGVESTGSIIISAGLIMAIAFSGVVFSSIPALNEVGLLMVVAVLVD